jgi:acetyl esterase/lipase
MSWENEGTEVAKWLSEHGIAAFVVKHRLVDTGPTDKDFRKSGTGVTSPPPEPTPLFVLCANDDPVAAQGSEAAYPKWKAAGYPAELYIFSKEGHGFSMNKQGLPTDHWIERFTDWTCGTRSPEAQNHEKPVRNGHRPT